ncbi:unnamed protein product [Calypogeia fissa]
MVTTDAKPNGGNPTPEEPLLVAEKNGVKVVTLNRPSKLNTLTVPIITKMIDEYIKWEGDDSTKMIILKGSGRVFCAGGDLNMFYGFGKSNEGWRSVVYRKYWFDYHLSTFKQPQVALLHGLVMGGGAGLSILGRFRVATEKTIFSMPEVVIGFHTDVGASYWLSRLPGSIGEYLALLGARLDGADMYTSGLATHYVPLEKLADLEHRLVELQSGDPAEIDAAIKEFAVPAKIGPNSIFNKERQAVIDRTFSKPSVEEIVAALEDEVKEPGQEWLKEPLKILRRSSPTALKVVLQSIRTGRNQTLPEALKREFRLSINCLRALISDDLYEGIRAVVIEKDNAPKWKPATLEEVTQENLDKMLTSFKEEEDLRLPEEGKLPRWGGSWEETQKA